MSTHLAPPTWNPGREPVEVSKRTIRTICEVDQYPDHEHHRRSYMPSLIIHTSEVEHGTRNVEIWVYHSGFVTRRGSDENSYLAGTLLLREGDAEWLFPTAVIKHGALGPWKSP